MAAKKYIKKSDSKETLRTFTFNKKEATVFPNFSFKKAMDMVDEDPVARGALNHYVAKCMEGDINIIKRDTFKYDPKEEMTLQEKYNFRTLILRKIFLMGKIFNNVFVEIVRDSKEHTKSLNVLDTSIIDPITNSNGDPMKTGWAYQAKIQNPDTGERAKWKDNEITWIKFGDRSEGFAPVDLRALWENLLAKEYIKRYVAWLWKTGQYRLLYNFDTATDKPIEDFLAYTRKHDNNFQVPFVAGGKLETKVLRDMKETESLVELLKYYDGQTLIALRVPPIDAGIPDASGRSSSDAQSNNLITDITSAKKIVEDYINFDLFPKINKSNSLLRFAPADRFAEKMVYENLQIMQSLGMTNGAMKEYLHDRGIYFKAKEFNPQMQESPFGNPRDKDMMPSRLGKGEGEANKKIGTGEQGTTRTDQMRKE